MQETFEEYKKRILGYQAGRDPIKVQVSTPKKIERLLDGVARNRLTLRPAPGKWSVAEILAHLADCELVGGYRIRKILGAPGTPIQGFDQDKWAEAGRYARRDPRKSLALFRALRDANLVVLKSLDRAQWNQYGMHSERGKETIEKMVELYAGHDINHLRQIQAILGSG
ncbi:MAG: DinB family protein [Acidobacteria bacterium]|nr:DinB family protein [Acidobacteriota bacterium]